MAKAIKVEGDAVNLGDLVKLVAEESGCSQNEVRKVLNALFAIIPSLLAQGKKVVIRNFVSFYSTKKAAHEGRNPKNGEKIQVEEKIHPKANFSDTVKELLNLKK